MRKVEAILSDKENENKAIDDGLYEQKILLNAKNDELIRLKHEQVLREADIAEMIKRNCEMQKELRNIHDDNIDIIKTHENISVANNQLKDELILLQNNSDNAEEEVRAISERIEQLKSEIQNVRSYKNVSGDQIDVNDCYEKINTLNEINKKLEDEVDYLAKNSSELEFKVEKNRQEYNSNTLLLDSYYKELFHLNKILRSANNGHISAKAQFKKSKEDNKILREDVGRHKQEAEVEKKECDVVTEKKVMTEIAMKNIEHKKIDKDMEAEMMCKKLYIVKDRYDQLMQDKVQLDSELDALKQHTELLNSQNEELNSELDQFVGADEVVKKDLNRKERVEYIKNKNMEECINSIRHLKETISPEKRLQTNY